MAKTKDKSTVAVDALKPYMKRAMEDPELRDDLVAAFVAARSLYGQISKGEGVRGKAEKISEKDFQKQLQSLVSDVTEASDRLKGEKEEPQDAQPRDPAHRRDARGPVQPVDGPGHTRVDHGSHRRRQRGRVRGLRGGDLRGDRGSRRQPVTAASRSALGLVAESSRVEL